MELTGEKKDWGRGMAEAFSMVKDQAPLVHMIANYVTASFCADAMAAMGARPVSYTHLAFLLQPRLPFRFRRVLPAVKFSHGSPFSS